MVTKNVEKTQIRKSDVDGLLKKVKDSKYRHYLQSMKIEKLRGLVETSIYFDFPVTAIVGPNGSGKSTVLGAAGLYSKTIQPRMFFARSGKYDESMRGWSVEHTFLMPKPTHPKGLGVQTRMSASFKQAKWNRKAVNRQTKYIGIARTIPAAERTNLSKFVGGNFTAENEVPLKDETKTAVARILGKDASSYMSISNESGNEDLISLGKAIYASVAIGSSTAASYSEFHFGAGEASIISIVDQIENADEEALILIEEIENGLHPVATRKLVEYLIRVAIRKRIQIIFTTHSNDALFPLPDEAVWAVSDGKLSQGKLDVASLRALTGQIETTCAVFTEDEFGSLLAELTLRGLSAGIGDPDPIDLSRVDFYHLGGEGQVLKHARAHNSNPSIDFPVVGLLDGDIKSRSHLEPDYEPKLTTHNGIDFKDLAFAPGDSDPEQAIFEDIIDNISREDETTSLGRLTVRLGLNVTSASQLKTEMERIYHTSSDPHLLFDRLGEKLGFLPGAVVARAFIATWCEVYPEKVVEIWEDAIPILPKG